MTALRVLTAAGLLAVGAVSGMAAVLVHARWWGVPLVVAAVVATLVALPGGWWSRVAFSAGWVVALGYALVPRPEGDFLLAATLRGYLLLGTSLVVVVWAIATLPRRARVREASVDPGQIGCSS